MRRGEGPELKNTFFALPAFNGDSGTTPGPFGCRLPSLQLLDAELLHGFSRGASYPQAGNGGAAPNAKTPPRRRRSFSAVVPTMWPARPAPGGGQVLHFRFLYPFSRFGTMVDLPCELAFCGRSVFLNVNAPCCCYRCLTLCISLQFLLCVKKSATRDGGRKGVKQLWNGALQMIL